MRHVLWIGGPPGAGKSTVARRLARRHGLRLYAADSRTWAHRDQAIAAGVEAAIRFEALSPAERLAADPQEALRMSLHHERGPMVVADVQALPTTPPIIAEGSCVPAWVVSAGLADAGQTVWLLPPPDVQAARLRARGVPDPVAAVYCLLGEVIAAEAREHGVRVLPVDESMTVDRVVAAVEELFAPGLSGAPAVDVLGRRRLLREMNLAVVEQVRGHYARPWASGRADDATTSFVCECGNGGCQEEVERTVGQAAAAPVLAPHAGDSGIWR